MVLIKKKQVYKAFTVQYMFFFVQKHSAAKHSIIYFDFKLILAYLFYVISHDKDIRITHSSPTLCNVCDFSLLGSSLWWGHVPWR